MIYLNIILFKYFLIQFILDFSVDKGKYGVIIFENLDRYLTMDKWNRELLDKYCRQYQVVKCWMIV